MTTAITMQAMWRPLLHMSCRLSRMYMHLLICNCKMAHPNGQAAALHPIANSYTIRAQLQHICASGSKQSHSCG